MEDSKKIESASLEEAKNIVIESFTPNCRAIGKSFLNCIEGKLLLLGKNSNLDYNEAESLITTQYLPDCLAKFNVEECIQRNGTQL